MAKKPKTELKVICHLSSISLYKNNSVGTEVLCERIYVVASYNSIITNLELV